MAQPHPMRLLAGGVPLTLLLDLADAEHLPSRSICRHERGDASWLRAYNGHGVSDAAPHASASQSSRRSTTPSRSAHGQMSTRSTPKAVNAS